MLAPKKAQIQLKKINHKPIRKKDRGPHLGLVSDEEDTTENIYPDKEPNIFEESRNNSLTTIVVAADPRQIYLEI